MGLKIPSKPAHSWIHSTRKKWFSHLQCNIAHKMSVSQRHSCGNVLLLALSFNRRCIKHCIDILLLWNLGFVGATLASCSHHYHLYLFRCYLLFQCTQLSFHTKVKNMTLGSVKDRELFTFVVNIFVHAMLWSQIWTNSRIKPSALEVEL